MRKPIQKPFERDELIQELKKEFTRLGNLQLSYYDKHRRDHLPVSHIVRKKLGNISWNEVVKLCGYDPLYRDWSKEKIIKLAKSKGRQLSFNELIELGINRGTTSKYFKNYKGLYDALGWEYEEKTFYDEVTNEDLLEEFKNVCTFLAKTATVADIDEHSKYPYELFRTRFGTLNELKRQAGYEYKVDPRTITKEDCMREMLNIYSKYGRISYSELEKRLPFHTRTMLRKFGTTSIYDVWEEVKNEHKRRMAK